MNVCFNVAYLIGDVPKSFDIKYNVFVNLRVCYMKKI